MNYERASSRDATPTSANTTAVCEAMCAGHITREHSNKHCQSAVISIWREVTLPDWIPLTHWKANMSMCGCGLRALTELTCTHPHTHSSLLKYELLSLTEYKRHFSSSSLAVKSHVRPCMWTQTTCAFLTDVGFQDVWEFRFIIERLNPQHRPRENRNIHSKF